jgi:hypothetical protein
VEVDDTPAVESRATSIESSALDRIKARREDLRKERHLELEVPGYGGELVVRYRPVPWDGLREIARKVDRSNHPRKELNGQVDTLIAACDEVLIRVEGDLQPIEDGQTTRFDGLPDLLGYEATSARAAVFGLFNNDLAVVTAHNDLAEWMAGAEEEADEELLGE